MENKIEWPPFQKCDFCDTPYTDCECLTRNNVIKDCIAAYESHAKAEGQKELVAENLEELSAEVHKVYCRQYEKNFGKPFKTGGDYSKLDEPTKDYDRALVKWMISKFGQPLVPLDEDAINEILISYCGHRPLADDSCCKELGKMICSKFGQPAETSVPSLNQIEKCIYELQKNIHLEKGREPNFGEIVNAVHTMLSRKGEK